MPKKKDEIREDIRKRRRCLEEFKKKELDEKIIRNLLSSAEWKKANTVLLYISNSNEINTLPLIKESFASKTIVVPKTHIISTNLTLHKISGFQDLMEGNHNLMEPASETKILSPSKVDLAIIPGIAFDKKGNRIGYGKGYYDRLNKKLKCNKISLAYNFQIIDNIPAQAHDTPIDIIITENQIIHINS